MTDIPLFPRALLREKSHSWNLLGVAQTPGQTTQNAATIVRSDGGGFWSCVMSDISLSGRKGMQDAGRDRQKISALLWRAVRQVCDGGVNLMLVPRNDALVRPWPAGVAPDDGIGFPHSDESLFDDGSGYYQPMIDIVSGAGALRATSMTIAINQAGDLQGGESFSIDHATIGRRLYEISTVVYSSAAAATIGFRPPLREAVTAGTAMDFDRPGCMMRLAKTTSMDLSVAPWTFNTASVDFVEAFPS